MEVTKIIENMKIKNGGVDKINAKTPKAISEHIADPLAHIINKCIEKSIWPDALKAAEVELIYKSGKKLVFNNYRPVSLILNITKIFEKVIYEINFDFIYKHKILSEKQFGFIKNKGTRDTLSYCKVYKLPWIVHSKYKYCSTRAPVCKHARININTSEDSFVL